MSRPSKYDDYHLLEKNYMRFMFRSQIGRVDLPKSCNPAPHYYSGSDMKFK